MSTLSKWLRVGCSWLLWVGVARADEAAVERGLAWLASQQRADGSWSTNVALNALAVLAFLSAGKPEEPVVERGLEFVLSQQSPDGAFTAGGAMMYGQGIATLLLAECVGMTGLDERVRPALEKAVRLILRAQAVEKSPIHAGGWRYEPHSRDSDISVTVWQIAALKAASEVGVRVPAAALQRAVEYVKRCRHPSGAFGYQPGGFPNQSRTAMAVVALRLCGRPDDPAVAGARAWLEANPLRWDSEYFYHAAFYCAHAGAGFEERVLLARQNDDGSWPVPPNSPDEARAGPLYATSMAVLALSAKWKFLPAYLW